MKYNIETAAVFKNFSGLWAIMTNEEKDDLVLQIAQMNKPGNVCDSIASVLQKTSSASIQNFFKSLDDTSPHEVISSDGRLAISKILHEYYLARGFKPSIGKSMQSLSGKNSALEPPISKNVCKETKIIKNLLNTAPMNQEEVDHPDYLKPVKLMLNDIYKNLDLITSALNIAQQKENELFKKNSELTVALANATKENDFFSKVKELSSTLEAAQHRESNLIQKSETLITAFNKNLLAYQQQRPNTLPKPFSFFPNASPEKAQQKETIPHLEIKQEDNGMTGSN